MVVLKLSAHNHLQSGAGCKADSACLEQAEQNTHGAEQGSVTSNQLCVHQQDFNSHDPHTA